MPYAQPADLTDRLGADLLALLADEDGDGAPDAAILAAAIEDAEAEVDAALAGRYATPIDPPPPPLRRLVVDLAVYLLFTRRRRAVAPEHLENWRAARGRLEAIAQGRADLEGVPTRLRRFEGRSLTLDQERFFDRDALDSF